MNAHLNSPFDTYIRKKLEYFSTGFNPADWARMSKLLDDSLEASVRARLEAHEAPFRPAADWPMMADVLDATFDDVVRDKIGAFSPEAGMDEDWALMQADIAAPFDREIHHKLVDYAAGYHPMEWLRMQAALDADDDGGAWWYVRWQTYALAASFVLIAMLAVGGANLLTQRLAKAAGISELKKVPAGEQENSALPQYRDKSLADESDPAGQLLAGKISGPLAEDGPLLTAKDEEKENALRKPRQRAQPVNPLAQVPANLIEPIDPNVSIHQSISPPVLTLATAEPVIHHAAETGIDADVIAGPDKMRPASDKKGQKNIELTKIRSAGTPIALGFFQSDLNDKLGNGIPKMDARVNLKNPEIRLGLYLATTHSVAELNDASKPGLGAGIRAEVRFDDQWSIVSGLLYTHKQFSHKYYIFADDRTQWENVLDADYRSLEVPVLVKYRFPRTGKIQLYAQAGIATMVTLEENYLRYNPLSFENADRISRSVDKSQHIPTNQKLTLNTYVGNIQAAAGLEYEVSDRISLQLEPYFQWGLQPMGTEQKSLHSLGVGTALVYKFGHKSS
jgi:hypothetical protein